MKRILAIVAALITATVVSLTVSAAPAQALGWSGQRCDNSHTGKTEDGWRMCTQFHTVALANGRIWIDTIQVCMEMVHSNNHISNSFQNSWNATGGVWGTMPNVDKGACGYSYPTQALGSVGAAACYNASGRINRILYGDTTWSTSGRVQGGAC